MKVTLDGVDIKPALALGSWLAFRKTGNQTMVMGDPVLTSAEVNPVASRLIEGGIVLPEAGSERMDGRKAVRSAGAGG